jgi:hypothetical protein
VNCHVLIHICCYRSDQREERSSALDFTSVLEGRSMIQAAFHVHFFSSPSCLLYILAQKSVQQQRLLWLAVSVS